MQCNPNILNCLITFIITKSINLAKMHRNAEQSRETVPQQPLSQTLLQSLANPQTLTYKNFLTSISSTPRYQYALIVFISLFTMLITFNAMIGAFVFMNPLFQCNGEETSEQDACLILDQCAILNDFTASYSNKLYCDKEQIRSAIQSIFGVGYIIGMVSVPLLSDILGRRKTGIIAFAAGVTAFVWLIIGTQKNDYYSMMAGSLVAGTYGAGITMFGFIITCDFCQEKMRQRSLLFYWALWGLAQMCFYPLYFHMPEWDKFLIYILLIPTSIMFILILYFSIESPVYAIFIKKDKKLFNAILNDLSRFNKISQQSKQKIKQEIGELIDTLRKNPTPKLALKKTLSLIVKKKKNLKILICLTLPLIAYNFFYYGLQGSMERTGYNFGLSMLLIGFNQLIAYLSASYLTQFMRRKVGTIVSIMFSAAVGLMFLIESGDHQQFMQSVLAIMARVGSVYIYCFIVLMQSQMLEVEIRSTSLAIINGSGQLGRIVVPFIINFLNDLGIHTIIISSIVLITLGIGPIILLKQTYKPKPKQNKIVKQKTIVAGESRANKQNLQ